MSVLDSSYDVEVEVCCGILLFWKSRLYHELIAPSIHVLMCRHRMTKSGTHEAARTAEVRTTLLTFAICHLTVISYLIHCFLANAWHGNRWRTGSTNLCIQDDSFNYPIYLKKSNWLASAQVKCRRCDSMSVSWAMLSRIYAW